MIEIEELVWDFLKQEAWLNLSLPCRVFQVNWKMIQINLIY